MVMPVAPVPKGFEIVPLFEIVLLEFSNTAGPFFETSTEPEELMVMLPGVLFAAAAVSTADVVLLLIVRSFASAGLASSAQAAPDARKRLFTRDLPPHFPGHLERAPGKKQMLKGGYDARLCRIHCAGIHTGCPD